MERTGSTTLVGRGTRRTRGLAGTRRLVDELLRQIAYAPKYARRIADAGGLPLALCRIADRADRMQYTWRAWSSDLSVSMIVAREMPSAAAGRRAHALHVEFYDADARLVTQGVWIRKAPKRWELSAL